MEHIKNSSTAAAAAAAWEVGMAEGYPSAMPPTPSASSDPSQPPPLLVLSPCSACKTLRRRCAEKCLLAPYFPPTEPHRFAVAHRVFGASNIIKLLQEIPEDQRADAVNSMVYEANARIRDPIYGCTGTICHLQNQMTELQSQLATAQAEILNMQCQNANLLDQFCQEIQQQNLSLPFSENSNFFF